MILCIIVLAAAVRLAWIHDPQFHRGFLEECDSFAGGKKSADKQQNTVVWITGNLTGGMTG